ncbi:hypothetical protein PoB_003751400 [Plakobranchus ocellatus]|uniref:Uncharacterized protein n=1 Tax=Plakobranchus ocellatus TaxID=259542 RepID=A0AAV4AY04_9GAST|nr:hypothetical protein PoB_003751400 [Plakobranchus ocellatus]
MGEYKHAMFFLEAAKLCSCCCFCRWLLPRLPNHVKGISGEDAGSWALTSDRSKGPGLGSDQNAGNNETREAVVLMVCSRKCRNVRVEKRSPFKLRRLFIECVYSQDCHLSTEKHNVARLGESSGLLHSNDHDEDDDDDGGGGGGGCGVDNDGGGGGDNDDDDGGDEDDDDNDGDDDGGGGCGVDNDGGGGGDNDDDDGGDEDDDDNDGDDDDDGGDDDGDAN